MLRKRVTVKKVLSSRYATSSRPSSWDERKDGIDCIRTTSGEEIKLLSNGQQSTPKEGWVILLQDGSEEKGFTWTLYGIPPGAEVGKPF